MAKLTKRGVRIAADSARRKASVTSAPALRTGPGRKQKKPVIADAATIARLTKRLAAARRHIARLEARVDTDFLLDIPNRHGFERELRRSIAFVKRYRATAALLLVDVDRLKPVNDRLGHAAGDQVLKAIVGILLAHIRQSDMLGRLGGDEFGILLWNLGEDDAQAKARALERAVEGGRCEYRGRRIALAVSIGVTRLGADDEAGSVLERADRMMYARKQSRRAGRGKAVRR